MGAVEFLKDAFKIIDKVIQSPPPQKKKSNKNQQLQIL